MRLCDRDIIKALETGDIAISPAPRGEQISGLTVDLHLGDEFRTFRDHRAPFLDLSGPSSEVSRQLDAVMSDTITISGDDAFFLHPGELALGVTAEDITLSSANVGWLDGRSSLARLGLMVHATAHRIDPGWSGQVVLEFFNAGKLPLALRPGMKIAAINFETLSGPALRPYNQRGDAKYRDQRGAVASRIDEDGA